MERHWLIVLLYLCSSKYVKAQNLGEYDFIVVGAGTAGCAIANRLSEIKNWSVLLVEAGGDEEEEMRIPINAPNLQGGKADWQYKTQPDNKSCLAMDNNQCVFPRGKVLGGSSVLNYMIVTRGHRLDYDTWEEMGNTGWGYDGVLPYFKKFENFTIHSYPNTDKLHGKDGPVTVSFPPFRTPISHAFYEANVEYGIPGNVDYNGFTQTAVSYLQTNTIDGSRDSSNRAYLQPILNRSNLRVLKNTMVQKILIHASNKTAYGIEIPADSGTQIALARKEVIVASGALNSPQLLMLSGIGPKQHLNDVGIDVVQDLPVGDNLQDHIAAGGLIFLVNQSITIIEARNLTKENLEIYNYNHTGPFTLPGGCEMLTFLDTQNPKLNDTYPDLEYLFLGTSLLSEKNVYKPFGIREDLFNKIYKPHLEKDSFMAWPMLLRPESMGLLRLKDKSPFSKPLIYPNYLATKNDVKVLVDGIKLLLEINKSPKLQQYGSRLIDTPIPACEKYKFGSDEYWECHIRHFTFNIYHQSGTCKMGPATDKTAVVSPRLKVHGVNSLRVIDASVMPKIPAAHTNVPTFMIAEKGADMIKEDWGVNV